MLVNSKQVPFFQVQSKAIATTRSSTAKETRTPATITLTLGPPGGLRDYVFSGDGGGGQLLVMIMRRHVSLVILALIGKSRLPVSSS